MVRRKQLLSITTWSWSVICRAYSPQRALRSTERTQSFQNNESCKNFKIRYNSHCSIVNLRVHSLTTAQESLAEANRRIVVLQKAASSARALLFKLSSGAPANALEAATVLQSVDAVLDAPPEETKQNASTSGVSSRASSRSNSREPSSQGGRSSTHGGRADHHHTGGSHRRGDFERRRPMDDRGRGGYQGGNRDPPPHRYPAPPPHGGVLGAPPPRGNMPPSTPHSGGSRFGAPVTPHSGGSRFGAPGGTPGQYAPPAGRYAPPPRHHVPPPHGDHRGRPPPNHNGGGYGGPRW